MMYPHERYHNDMAFRNITDLFLLYIREAKFTPSEIREAAMLAQIMYEETVLRPTIIERFDWNENRTK